MSDAKKTEGTGIYAAMVKVMRGIEAIGKGRTNQQQGFKFRGIDDVYNELHRLLADNGIFMLTEVKEDRVEERQTKSGGNLIYRILKIVFSFVAEDGSSVTSTMIGEGMDSGDKASNKAMAVAHKYALLQAFCVPTEDTDPKEPKDPDGTTQPPSVPKAPAAKKRSAVPVPESGKTPEAPAATASAAAAATPKPPAAAPAQPPKHIAIVQGSPKHWPIIKAKLALAEDQAEAKKTIGGELLKMWNTSKSNEADYLNMVEQYYTVPKPKDASAGEDDNLPF